MKREEGREERAKTHRPDQPPQPLDDLAPLSGVATNHQYRFPKEDQLPEEEQLSERDIWPRF